MNRETIYAVVDLETTGTNIKDGDRIIQFGCALVQNGKIIQTISQDVNPLRDVPTKIQHLTHITADQLELAPIFEDLAPTLVEILSGTVFVAHNINACRLTTIRYSRNRYGWIGPNHLARGA